LLETTIKLTLVETIKTCSFEVMTVRDVGESEREFFVYMDSDFGSSRRDGMYLYSVLAEHRDVSSTVTNRETREIKFLLTTNLTHFL